MEAKRMSEQLWYTWSTNGFGMTSAGSRVRAASKGLMDRWDNVNMQGEPFFSYLRYLNYDLPLDLVDRPHVANPAQTQEGLVFVDAGSARILVHKAYTGRDGVNRPGAFFLHLLTCLPDIGGQVPFSAREAISLW